MNIDLPTSLASRADSVEPPRIDPVAVVARGEQLVRRRRRFVVAGAALAVILTIGTTTLVLDRLADRDGPPPANPDRTSHGIVRPLTYGQGQVLHLGDREIDTGLDFLSLDVTDDGAALTTLDGGIWFTDGTEVDQVGATLGGRAVKDGVTWRVGRPRDWVVNDSSGSLLAWLEYPGGSAGGPELVVYDTARRVVAARQPLDPGSEARPVYEPVLAALAGRQVFVAGYSLPREQVAFLRYSLDSGNIQLVDTAAYNAAVRSVPRALVIGSTAHWGDVALHAEASPHLDRFDRLEVQDGRHDPLFDPHTGRRLDLRVPDAYAATPLWLGQWLDDDRFTMISGAAPRGDLLTCRISSARCEVTIQRSSWDDPPLLPGHGGVGAELALIQAAADSRD
jgi:hypothetical protein